MHFIGFVAPEISISIWEAGHARLTPKVEIFALILPMNFVQRNFQLSGENTGILAELTLLKGGGYSNHSTD